MTKKRSFQQMQSHWNLFLNGIPFWFDCAIKSIKHIFLIICFIEFIICSAPVKKVKVFLRDLTPKEISQMRRPKTWTSTTTTWSFFVPSIRRAIFINSIVEAEGKTNYRVLTDDLYTQRVMCCVPWVKKTGKTGVTASSIWWRSNMIDVCSAFVLG